jgi:hypothetical protein
MLSPMPPTSRSLPEPTGLQVRKYFPKVVHTTTQRPLMSFNAVDVWYYDLLELNPVSMMMEPCQWIKVTKKGDLYAIDHLSSSPPL